MATLVREAGVQPLVQFTVPYRGTWRSVAANQITPDSLYDSSNVFIREGKLRTRPGMALLNSTVFAAPVIGGAMAVTPTQKILLAVTKGNLYTLTASATSWSVDSTLTIATSDDSIADITFLETNSQYAALVAVQGQTLKRWISGSGLSNVIATVGTVPLAKSVTTAARRIVALVDPHTVVWTSTLTYDSWPALAIARIAQTNDVGICVKSLSNLTFVVYKERSIYSARAQAGSDAAAFAFGEPIKVEGPAGVHAVVDVLGSHFYMTANGRIAIYDGTRYPEWIADGLWLHLQADIDPAYSNKIFGVFDYRLHTVTFHYPRVGDAGALKGAVIINLPLQNSGVQTYAPFLATFAKPVSYGYEMRFNNQIDRSLLFSSAVADAQSFTFDENTTADDGTNFSCYMRTGLYPVQDLRHSYVSVENFFERANGYGHVDVRSITSDVLESKDGTLSNLSQRIDLNNNPVQEHVGFEVPTRFFGLRYDWSSSSTVRYAGAAVYGRGLT